MIGTAGEKEGVSEHEIPPLPLQINVFETVQTSEAVQFQPFSKYPFIVRDVALWTPANTQPDDVLRIIRTHAGELLVRSTLFDRFEKSGKLSLAFRLIFQSFDRTLFDEDANERMESIYTALKKEGYEIR